VGTMPEQRLAEQIERYLVAVVDGTGYWRVVATTIKRDEDGAAAVEVEFGLSEAVENAKALKKALRPGRCRIYIEQTRVRVPNKKGTTADQGLGALTLYEYDLVDGAYSFELAYHFHGHGGTPFYHGHRRDGQARLPIDPGFVSLENALNDFIAAVWQNRFPPQPQP